jgi:hypothetical protein
MVTKLAIVSALYAHIRYFSIGNIHGHDNPTYFIQKWAMAQLKYKRIDKGFCISASLLPNKIVYPASKAREHVYSCNIFMKWVLY